MREDKDNPAQMPPGDFSPEFDELWRLTGAWQGGPEPAVDAALERLHRRLAADETVVPRRLARRTWLRIAAAIALLLSVLLALRLGGERSGAPRIISTDTELATVDLPDGSRVLLNKYSSLQWNPNHFDGTERLVELRGEAFFEISPDADRPFRILAGPAEVRVIGTRFNVRAYPEETTAEVAVLSGEVTVATAGTTLELIANQCARLQPDAAPRLESMNAKNAIAWQTGQLVFRDAPLSQVVLQLERFFGVEIDWPAAADTREESCTVSAIWKDPELEQVLTAIQKLTGLQPQRHTAQRYQLVGSCND